MPEDRGRQVDRRDQAALVGRRRAQRLAPVARKPASGGPKQLPRSRVGHALHNEQQLAGGALAAERAQLGLALRSGGQVTHDQALAREQRMHACGQGLGGTQRYRRDASAQVGGDNAVHLADAAHARIRRPARDLRRQQTRAQQLGGAFGTAARRRPAAHERARARRLQD